MQYNVIRCGTGMYLTVEECVKLAAEILEMRNREIVMDRLSPIATKLYGYPYPSKGYMAQCLNKLGYKYNRRTYTWIKEEEDGRNISRKVRKTKK